jgi:hypothetical protein
VVFCVSAPAQIDIAAIKIGERFGRDMGDLDALVAEIAEIGLQPIGLYRDGTTLAFGERRLRAVQMLGWTEIPFCIIDSDQRAVEISGRTYERARLPDSTGIIDLHFSGGSYEPPTSCSLNGRARRLARRSPRSVWTNAGISKVTHTRIKEMFEASGRNMATGIDLLSLSWRRAYRTGTTDAERARYDNSTMLLDEKRVICERIFHDGGTPRRRSHTAGGRT